MLPLLFAWFAAAAFAASLGFFLYAYLVLFGQPAIFDAGGQPAIFDAGGQPAIFDAGGQPAPSAPGAGEATSFLVPAALNLLLFTIFALHHSLFARTGVKQLVKTWTPPALERALYSLVASAMFIVVCGWWLPVPGSAWHLDGPWRWLGYAVQAAGVIVTIIGARALDVLDLAGVRQVLRSSSSHVHAGGAQPLKSGVAQPFRAGLKTDGVYGLVRHPLYFGWTLLVFGAPDMTSTRLVFAIVSTLYLLIAIPFEERSLIETFGPDYASYQRKVRWRMIPGLY